MSLNPFPFAILPRKSNIGNWVNTTNSDVDSQSQRDSIFITSIQALKHDISHRTDNSCLTGSHLKANLNFNVSKGDFTFKHSKIFSSFRRSTQIAMQANSMCDSSNDNPVVNTRLRLVRHVVGFRSYNKAQPIIVSILSTVKSIKLLMDQPFLGLQYATETAETSLCELQQAEDSFFGVVDRMTRQESKLQELEFLKTNVERCIRASIVNARKELHSLEHSNTDQYRSMVNKLDNIIGQPWRGHNQLQLCLNELKCTVLTRSCLSVAFPSLVLPNSEDIHKLIVSIEEYSTLKNLQPKLKQIFTASVDVERLEVMLSQIKECEAQLTSALSLEQATASVMLMFAMEARSTTFILQKRTEKISLSLSKEKQHNIDAEENELYRFIYNGREYERQFISMKPTALFHERVFGKPISPDGSAPPLPIWARHWTDKTKILRRKM